MSAEEVETLKERSKKLLNNAKYNLSNGDYDLAAFNLEQALQLYLKSKLLEKGMRYPHTHDLMKLLENLKELTNEEIGKIISEYSVELGDLTDAYIMARYSTRRYTKEEIERLLKIVEDIVHRIERY